MSGLRCERRLRRSPRPIRLALPPHLGSGVSGACHPRRLPPASSTPRTPSTVGSAVIYRDFLPALLVPERSALGCAVSLSHADVQCAVGVDKDRCQAGP